MNEPPLVSVIIDNYNYARYLCQAIDSALAQTDSRAEVIVVDDGSKDNSREIIAGYGESVVPVFKENGGQASAFNAGFARCHGDVVIFLDADDILFPDVLERVAKVFDTCPQVAKVQYRLEVIDASGRRTGLVRPPDYRTMPSGDLRSQVLAFPDDIAWQPTSGNAFAAKVLQRIFPVPEDAYRVCADYYLSNLTPLFGTVVSLEHVGGYYRVHGANNHHTPRVDLEQTRQVITRTCQTHAYIKRAADSLGLRGFPADATDVPAVTFLAHRIMSLKLDAQHHPLSEDNLLSLFLHGVRASMGRFDVPWTARYLYALWFLAVLLAPRPAVWWLAEKFFYPEQREKLNKFLAGVLNHGIKATSR